MANGKFKADVSGLVAMTEKRTNAVMRESLQRTIDDAQTPVAKGGRMRVDTGFLRASGQASYTGLPTGPVRGDPDKKYETDESLVTVALSKLTIGTTFFFGWTANYAIYREAFDGFLEIAVMKWPKTVASVCEDVKARIKQ